MGKTLIKTITVPVDESGPLCEIDFIDGASDVVFDGTYPVYEFHFVNMHPESVSNFTFQVNATDGADFNDSLITSTHFRTYHKEDDSETHLGYNDGLDQAQVAGFQIMANNVDNVDDNGCSGVLTIYDPSSTTYVKHFTSTIQSQHSTTYSQHSKH
jgi:hypothetical protein